MKNFLLLLFTLALLTGVFVQTANADVVVTVTNPTYTTPNLAGTYPSLAIAINALNGITAISGGYVTLSCAASGTETAPVGGYVINFTATTTSSNYIIINGNGSTITASAALTAGNLNDAIFKIIGCDYITLKGFTMNENASNTTTLAASNNMTEWGVALLYASATNGAQNNTVQNNTITLNKIYSNTFGIYSNTRHTATAVTVTADITAATGANSNNKVYGNNISNVNTGITFIGCGAVGGAAYQDMGNDIGGSSVGTGNTISNWGGFGAASSYVSNSQTSYCIFMNHQAGENVSYNTITSASVSGTSVTFRGIVKDYTALVPAGTFTSNITNNTITMTSAFTSGTFQCIASSGMTALSTATININNNTILNCVLSGTATSSNLVGIINSSVPGVLSISNNIIRGNTSAATTGGFTGISNTGAVVTTCSINNNQIGNSSGDAISLSAITTGVVTGISNTGGGTNCALSITGNNFQGFTYVTASTGTFQCINTSPAVLTETVNNNNFNNLTINAAGALTNGVLIGSTNATPTVTVSGNFITTQFTNLASLAGNYRFVGNNLSTAATGSATISNNTISNVTFNAPLGSGCAIIWECGSGTTCSHNITVDGNTISNIKNTGISTTNAISLFGIRVGLGNNNVISNNNINLLENRAGSTFGIITGSSSTNTSGGTYNINNNIIRDIKCTNIYLATPNTVGQAIGMQLQTANLGVTNVFKNKIYDLNSIVPSSGGGGVAGIVLFEGNASHTANIYNNYIGRLYSPTPYFINAVRGIINANSAANTSNIYYNTVYLDGNNSVASYCYYSQAATPISNLRNNIFINNCVPTGTWEQMVYFIFGTLPATYATTSNNNLLYCGTPGPLNLIYADGAATALTNKQQTLTAFKAYVGPTRESASVTENTSFLNTSVGSGPDYLHINTAVPTQVESGAVNIATYTDDYDNVIRQGNAGYSGTGTAPDIGADEGEFIFPIPMVYVSSTTTQNTANTAPNITNQQIIGIQVVTNGTVTPLTVSSFTVNANGSSNVSDITNARIYYTGSTPVFSTTGLFGTFASPTLTSFNIAGSQLLTPGTNYFWLTFDITPGAIVGHIVDAECTQVVGSGTMGTQTPTVTAPAGARTISGPMSGDYTVGLTGFNKAAGTNISFRKVVKKVMKEIKELTVEKPLTQNAVVKGKSAISASSSDLKSLPANTTVGDEVIGIQQFESPLLSSEQVTSRGKWVEVEEISWVPMENGVVYNGPLSAVTSGNSTNAPLVGVYPTITAAVADLNIRGVNGPVRFLLNDASYTTGETFPIIINVLNASVPNVTNTVTIKPNAGVVSSITGASSGAEIFRIYKTNYVTIDGSNTVGGTTRDLTITNTSAASPEVINFNSTGTTPVVGAGIKNCNIINGSQNSSAVILTDLAGTAGYFNNITIQNNSIQKAYIGIYNLAAVLSGNGTGLNISGNDLNTSGSNSIRLIGIYVQGFDGANVSNNNIGNVANTIDASNLTGIWFTSGTINSVISGNTISNISGTASAPRGIVITSAVTNANINVTGNTITGLTSNSTGTTTGIASTTSGVIVQKNKISNIKNTNIGGWGCNGIDVASSLTAANMTLSNNVIYDVAAYGFEGGGVADNGYGIVVESGAGYNIYYNSVSMNINQNVAGYPAAINILSGVTAVGAINLINNIFSNSQTVGTERYAIYCEADYTVFSSIGYNDYYTTGANLGYMTTASVLDLAAWRFATGQDLHSISDNPLFTSSVNLLPQSTSPTIGAALPLPGIVDFDIDGTPRNATAPTMGAYEAFAAKTLNLTLFLEGLLTPPGLGGLMRQAQGVSGPQFGTDIADNVTVELHNITPPYAISTYPPFSNVDLKTDGTLAINTIPGGITGSYYVVIKHRNSIETWSMAPVSFAGAGPVSYDFSTAASQAYGDNMRLMNGVYAIWGSDANQDGSVDATDMAMIDNASQPPVLNGYNPEDINGDGTVDGTDMLMVDNNSQPPVVSVKKP